MEDQIDPRLIRFATELTLYRRRAPAIASSSICPADRYVSEWHGLGPGTGETGEKMGWSPRVGAASRILGALGYTPINQRRPIFVSCACDVLCCCCCRSRVMNTHTHTHRDLKDRARKMEKAEPAAQLISANLSGPDGRIEKFRVNLYHRQNFFGLDLGKSRGTHNCHEDTGGHKTSIESPQFTVESRQVEVGSHGICKRVITKSFGFHFHGGFLETHFIRR